ncbi:hypothetical protein Ddye_015031 [Dipteronia dyeriana]|uniref:Uncharacterized protein n=1 Tax=Dipteronia dyeriana TaxID=168575 RepID=A0AAD9U465_9ROSI|nr:hypothetical protein Ddye_015031 [Dipteronia dyeriana]
MLENPTQTPPAPAAPDSAPVVVKRYAHPHQRNRLRRKPSGDRFDRTTNLYGNDGEKNQLTTPRNTPVINHGDTALRLIHLEGISRSDAAQLLDNRWRTAMHNYNDTSIDLSERPVLYTSGTSAWGQFKLPHQMMAPANSVGPLLGTQMDFLAELRHKMHNADANFDN